MDRATAAVTTPHTVATAPADWISGALTFRNRDGYFLHGQPCPYSDEIVARFGSNAQLHEVAVSRCAE